MKRPKAIISFLIVLLAVEGLDFTAVQVHAAGAWAPDARVPGYLDDTFPPFLVADRNQTVHAFTSQWVNDGDRSRQAIVYRQWSRAGGWTRPVDIILASAGDAQILGAFLDPSDRVHIIFLTVESGRTALNYSFAPAANADQATAWSLPEIVGNDVISNSAAITGDDHGNLIVIYSGDSAGSGVYFITSADGGMSWSKPSTLFLTNDTNLVPYILRLAMGRAGQVRAAWSVFTTQGSAELLYFANYSISNSTWSDPVELDSRIDIAGYFGPSFPALVDTGSKIVILYNGGNTFPGQSVNLGRPVMRVSTSSDGGLTWNGPFQPFPLLNGRSGEHALVVDGAGTAHGLFVMRIDQLVDGTYRPVVGIWHSSFRDDNWTTPDRLATTYVAHDVRAVVSQGNVLLVVWRQDPGQGMHGVWFSYTILDAPELPVTPLASAAAISPSQQPAAARLLGTPTPSPANAVLRDPPPPQWRSNPAFPLLAGTIPAAAILIGVLVSNRFFKNQRK